MNDLLVTMSLQMPPKLLRMWSGRGQNQTLEDNMLVNRAPQKTSEVMATMTSTTGRRGTAKTTDSQTGTWLEIMLLILIHRYNHDVYLINRNQRDRRDGNRSQRGPRQEDSKPRPPQERPKRGNDRYDNRNRRESRDKRKEPVELSDKSKGA